MTDPTEHELAPVSRSPWQLAFRRFRKNKRALIALIIVTLIGLSTIVVPMISPHSYEDPDYSYDKPAGPDSTHWFGIDQNYRDLMVRTFKGGQISFAVGILATAVAVIIGVAYGSISGYMGGKTDLIMMRVVDVLYGLPYMLIVIIAITMLPKDTPSSTKFVMIFLVLGCFGWLTMSRIVRGQVLSLKEREFVEAARALGVGTRPIIMRHMVPNLLGPVIVYATLTVPAVMLQEAFLSFLGLGISQPMTSWGKLIAEGAGAITVSKGDIWWMTVFPGVLFTITLYCLNSVGDGIRDAFDVQQR